MTHVNGVQFGTYDSANKLTLSTGTISHDADGNISAVDGAGIDPSDLYWNTRSKLTQQITQLGWGQIEHSFGYDSFGRRVWTSALAALDSMMSFGDPVVAKTFYIYSGDLLLASCTGATLYPPELDAPTDR